MPLAWWRGTRGMMRHGQSAQSASHPSTSNAALQSSSNIRGQKIPLGEVAAEMADGGGLSHPRYTQNHPRPPRMHRQVTIRRPRP